MDSSERSGFALASALAEDRGIDPAQLPAATRERGGLESAAEALRTVPLAGVSALDPRGRVLCAAMLPRAAAAKVARGLPRPRRGFAPLPALRDQLARMARAGESS